MAGMFKVHPCVFLAMDTVGAILWSGVYLILGWWFRDQWLEGMWRFIWSVSVPG